MNISSKTKFAVKIVKLLIERDVIKGAQISKELEISGPYFEQIVAVLIKHKMVQSKRGCRGGYTLDMSDGPIRLFELYAAFNKTPDLESPWDVVYDGMADAMGGIRFERKAGE